MAERPFYAPVASHDARRFQLRVAPDVQVGAPDRQFLMGGVGLGSAIVALEQVTGRPLVWATAQYLSFAPPGSTLDIDVHLPVEGRSVTQARVTSHVGEKEIITVNAALGARGGRADEQFMEMPEVPAPEACPLHETPNPVVTHLHARREQGDVAGDAVEHRGHSRMWMRCVDDEPVTAGLLAVFADFLPAAIPVTRRSSSLDNTLRIRRLVHTRWCLVDARIQGLSAGFFHGEACLFAEDGTLLATASQSGALPKPA